jgi:hypothetical protein
MPSIGSITKTIRINAEDLKVIEEIMGREGVTWSGAIHYLVGNGEGTPSMVYDSRMVKEVTPLYDIDPKYLADMDSMKSFMGGSVGEMIRLFDECLNDGTIYFENGTFVGVPPINLDKFLEACREVGADPQKVLDKATAGIRR